MATDEETIAAWVQARLKKRHDIKGQPPPSFVQNWVNWLKTLPAGALEDAPAQINVLNWVSETIEDPDWAE